MNLGQLRTDVRSRIMEPVARTVFDTEINRWINAAYHDFAAYVEPCKKVKAYTIAQLKKAVFDLPTDCFGIERINWTEQFPLLHVTEMEFRQRMWTAPTATTTRPFMYQQNPPMGTGGQFQIWPGPSAVSAQVNLLTTINSTATTIHTSTIPTGTVGMTADTFPTQGYIWIENEQIRYWDIDTVGNNFLYCERGSGYTTAASHIAGGYYSPAVKVTYAPMQVLYRFDPPDLVSDSDTLLFSGNAWHEAIVCYAAANSFWKRQEVPQGNKMMENYSRIREEAKLVRERETFDRPTVFMGEDPAEYMNWW